MNKVRESIYDEDKRYNLDTLAAVSQLGIISVSQNCLDVTSMLTDDL